MTNNGTTTMSYSNEKETKERFLQALAAIGDGVFSADQGIAYHKDPKNKISLPEGMTAAKGAATLADVAQALTQTEVFTKTFKYRPLDGAYALTQVMAKFFGTTGRGVPIQTMFGSIPPQQREIEISPGVSVQVPWGHIAFEHFDGTLMLGAIQHEELGLLFQVSLECPKIHGKSVSGFWKLIEEQLERHSIYKGQSFRERKSGQDDGIAFLNLAPNRTIVYNDDVYAKLENTVWGVIENAELFRQDHRKLNRRVLLFGPYGTGKSECGVLTADLANRHGWTFIQFHSGKGTLDDLEATLNTAKLYQPAVVFIEDVDIYAANQDEKFQARLSNLIDGVGSKGDKVMLVMTSNRAATFSKAMLRAGRIDAMIEVGPLNRDATEKMIRLVIGDARLSPEIDFNAIHEAMEGYEPAFVRLTFDQAAEAAIIRNKSLVYQLDTPDFVNAANLLRPQHDLHTNRAEKDRTVTLDTLMTDLITDAVTKRIEGKLDIDTDDWTAVTDFSEKAVV